MRSAVPMMAGAQGQAIGIAASHHAAALFLRFDAVVALLAERLPIGLIPEQGAVTAVRHHVVDHRCCSGAPHLLAQPAQWVRCQVSAACSQPAIVVPTLGARAALLVVAAACWCGHWGVNDKARRIAAAGLFDCFGHGWRAIPALLLTTWAGSNCEARLCGAFLNCQPRPELPAHSGLPRRISRTSSGLPMRSLTAPSALLRNASTMSVLANRNRRATSARGRPTTYTITRNFRSNCPGNEHTARSNRSAPSTSSGSLPAAVTRSSSGRGATYRPSALAHVMRCSPQPARDHRPQFTARASIASSSAAVITPPAAQPASPHCPHHHSPPACAQRTPPP